MEIVDLVEPGLHLGDQEIPVQQPTTPSPPRATEPWQLEPPG